MPRTRIARRPTKAMMLAVNAAIDGDNATLEQLIIEEELDQGEIEARMAARGGRKYELRGSRPARRPRRKKTSSRPAPRAVDLQVTIDGRTSVRQLFRLLEQAERVRAHAQQELKRRSPDEIEPVKRALAEIELLRREREKLDDKIRSAEDALG